MKIDFHVHTKYSHDSSAEVAKVLMFAKRRGLDAIVIADHDSLEGNRAARKIRSKHDVLVIPGIELTLPAGKYGLHIIAINIDEYITFNSITSAITQLKRLGATLILPHPYRVGTGIFYHQEFGTLTSKDVLFILKNIDYVEAINLKDSSINIRKSLEFAAKAKYPIVSGTDAHFPEYVGLTYTKISSIEGLFSLHESGIVSGYLKHAHRPELIDLSTYIQTGQRSHNEQGKKRVHSIFVSKIMTLKYLNAISRGAISKIEGFRRRSSIKKITGSCHKFELLITGGSVKINYRG